MELDLGSNHLSILPEELEALVSLEMFRLSYNQLRVSLEFIIKEIREKEGGGNVDRRRIF